MRPDLRKAGFHTHDSKTYFSPSKWLYILTNNSGNYWCWKLPKLLLLWVVSEAYQMSTSAWVAFKWLHIPLASRQLDVRNSPHDWLISLAMDLAALCDMWKWKWHQWMPFGRFYWRHSLFLPLCGYLPTPTLPPYRSATGIGNTTKKVWNGWEIYLAIHPIVSG